MPVNGGSLPWCSFDVNRNSTFQRATRITQSYTSLVSATTRSLLKLDQAYYRGGWAGPLDSALDREPDMRSTIVRGSPQTRCMQSVNVPPVGIKSGCASNNFEIPLWNLKREILVREGMIACFCRSHSAGPRTHFLVRDLDVGGSSDEILPTHPEEAIGSGTKVERFRSALVTLGHVSDASGPVASPLRVESSGVSQLE